MPLIDFIKSNFSSELISEMATNLGESESSISKSIGILLPTVLGKLLNFCEQIKSSETTNEENSVIQDLEKKTIDFRKSNFLKEPPSDFINLIVEKSGISHNSAISVLDTVANITLSSFTKFTENKTLNNKDFYKILNEQKALIPSILPAGISLFNIGLEEKLETSNIENKTPENTIIETVKPIEENITTDTKNSYQNEKSFWNWLLPLILLGIAAWYFWKVYEKQNLPEKTRTEEKR